MLKVKYLDSYSFKINGLIQSSQAGGFFSTQLLLKISVFELNNRFVFHGTSIVDIQPIPDFLQLILGSLASCNTFRSSTYKFPVVSVKDVPPRPSGKRFDFHAVQVIMDINVKHTYEYQGNMNYIIK